MMKKMISLGVLVCLVLSCAALAVAQSSTSMPGPPKVLQIYREEVKVGKGAAHEKFEAGFVQASQKANWPTHYLAVSSISGPSEAWFLTGYDSVTAWEKDRQATEKNAALTASLDQLAEKDADFISGGRSIVALYREELSYRTSPVNLGQERYFYVTTIRVRPGHEADFVEANKIVRAAHEKASVPENWSVFQVTIGMPSGTYLIFQPMKTLAEVDAFPQTHGTAYQDALGDEGRKKLRELNSAATLNTETNIFAFSPKMSYASPELVAADPEFWQPKAGAQVARKHAPASKSGAAKVVPTTKKEATKQ